jgi:hypothetical protein
MTFINALPPYLLALGALVCFGMALYFFWHESLKTAGALSALFFLCVILAYLPQAESINAFAVNVKLKQNVELAKDAIEQLRELSKVNARVGYTTVAWGNRLGSPTALEKKAILDQVDQQLEALQVSKAERKDIARPLIRLIGLDLYQVFIRSMDRFVHVRNREWGAEVQLISDSKRAMEESLKYNASLHAWRDQLDHPEHDIDGYSLRSSLRRALPAGTWVAANDVQAAQKLADEIQLLFDDCVKAGGYTAAAAQFLDRYSDTKGYDEKVKEIFGRS